MSEMVNYTSPWGKLVITIEDEKLSHIDFESLQSVDRITTVIKNQVGPEPGLNEKALDSVLAQQVRQQLDEYFVGRRKVFDLALRPRGTSFQQEVWLALQHIPYAEVLSYGQLAAAINRPKAQRAVGMACNRNPLPIIISCHRVVGSSGHLTGYAGGLEMKANLLQLEKRFNK